ncbi:FAD dependent dehydrogenase [Streptomyces sp. TR1341]|uniref:FAD binding domain-containing protein n=1 Tax=Streptomyces sp. TR1341 TaxID=2601266 RepID=UPI00138AE6C5|nr:FAD dependent dehydrogenase [Streptomyces sp. TR1341]
MLLRLPTSVSEAQECLAEGAVPVGGATLVWATWQREGFPELAMSLRKLPQANVIGAERLGAAVLLGQMDGRVPDVLRRAAGTVGTGAVRRAATVGGNLVGSALRCLLPAALVLDARATVLESDGVRETDLAEVVAKRPLLLSLRWSAPLACAYRKLPADAGAPPPLAVASALHAGDGAGDGAGGGAGYGVRVAARDGYEVFEGAAVTGADPEETLESLRATALGDLPAAAWAVVRPQVLDLLARER